MSSTSQVTDFSDMYTDLINRVRQATGVTATNDQAKRYINIGLQDMHIGFQEKMPWAERHAILVTQPDYNTGTITVSQGSSSCTGSSTLWNTANANSVNNVRVGGKLKIDGTNEVYEVTSIASDTSLTLTSNYVGADVSAGNYTYFEDEYDLDDDFLRPIDIQSFDANRGIKLMSRTQFRRLYPRNNVPGKPLVAMIADRPPSGNTTPRRRVRLWHPPNEFFSIPYDFITNKLVVTNAGAAAVSLSNDDDEPIVPLQYRHVIVFHALYHWYRDKRDDTRSQEAKGEYTDLLLRITGDQEIGRPRPQLQPNRGVYSRSAKKPFRRGRSSRFVVGSSFDELR